MNAAPQYASPKIRADDYAVAQKVATEFPVSVIDVITGFRLAWDQLPEEQKLELLRKVARDRTSNPRGRPRQLTSAA
jgi:hypothetical protein